MVHLIDKDALVAEIDRLEKIQPIDEIHPKEQNKIDWLAGKEFVIITLQVFLDTLEAEDVDVDGERRKYLTEHFNVYEDGILQSKRSNLPLDTYDVIEIIKHFFELGMQVSNKSQKGRMV